MSVLWFPLMQVGSPYRYLHGYDKVDLVRLSSPVAHTHPDTALERVLYRVGEQVGHGLLDAQLIAKEGPQPHTPPG